MLATGWHGGNAASPHEPAGYGVKFTVADRDAYFDESWTHAVLDLDGAGSVSIPLSPSFWRSCSELRSADVGRWFLEAKVAPWPKGNPPGIVVKHIERNRFAARVHIRKTLPFQ